ncbi:MAG: hypothetical protein JW818_19975 [Pirellulales bacterium]|nr:hypothetical protein [Pirellulales bacterium]
MVLKTSSVGLIGLVLLAALVMVPDTAEAARRTSPDLFYNYYVPPGPCGGVGAQLYVSPRPVPERVGHTWITYQPLMPHEFLYTHHRTYYRRHEDARCTKTHVKWSHALLPDFTPTYIDARPLTHLFGN